MSEINPSNIFINSKNFIYVLNRQTDQIHIWNNDSSPTPSRTVSSNLSNSSSIFVNANGDIYIDNGAKNGRVVKWVAATNTWIGVMLIKSSCFGLFINMYDELYCSLHYEHRIVKKWLHESINTKVTDVAGTGHAEFQQRALNHPTGIFVADNLNLYVADSANNRIQLFAPNTKIGKTIAGNGSSPKTIELFYPTGIVLDGDAEVFIVDSLNHRIVRSYQGTFFCIIGCNGLGSLPNQLMGPHSMAFDSYGNGYVIDSMNHRMQKFMKSKFCSK